MTRCRPAVAVALLAAALATAGCGIGPGAGVGEVSLTVTRDYGARRLVGPERETASESDTAMRLLDRNAEISTRYGGRFVQAIDGTAEATRGGDRFDWFFYVNGVESPVGAADYALHGGDSVWWDYRNWSAAETVPAVVGSWPQPFRDGYEGKPRPVAVECLGGGAACGEVRARLRSTGARLVEGAPADALRVLVGPWARVREDPAAVQIEAGPQESGVFAQFAPAPRPRRAENVHISDELVPPPAGGYVLHGLDERGREAKAFGSQAGLVAATRRYEAPPVWVVTGATRRGVAAAADLLDARDLRDRYAVAVEGGRETSLPTPAGVR
jgi:Domain of unknown function (DUF4430)